MPNPLVSIIIPVYGVEDYIARCARSVFRQTYQNLEIIFVDDCALDDSIDVLRQVMEEYPERKAQVKILKHEHNRGLSAARNTGMEAATGAYIYFLDSDDAITEDCIETQEKPMEEKHWDMVTADYKEEGWHNSNEDSTKVTLQDAEYFGDDIIKSFSSRWHWNAWNKLFDRNYLLKYDFRFVDGIYFEDVPFTFKVACTASAIKVIGKETYIYVNRPTSIMNVHKTDKYISSYRQVAEEMHRVQKQYKAFSYDAEKWINVMEDKVEQLVTSQSKYPPHQLAITGSEALTTEPSEKSGSAIADLSESCHTTSTGSCQSDLATCGTSGTVAGIKVTIIVPVYNVEKYIARCARSVFRQTYRNLEIIFVDDCTPDNSIGVLRQVMEEYPERKALVKILKHEHNRGLSAARNTGMEAATGEYIYFLDSDDEITRDCIEVLVAPLEKQKYDFVIGNIKFVDFSHPEKMPHLSEGEGPICGDAVLDTYNEGKWYCMAWNKLLNRHFLIKNGLYFKEGLIHEDELWSYQLSVTAKLMYVVSKVTYIYYNRPGSIMTTKKIERDLESFKTIIEEARKTQQRLHLFSYRENFRIDCFQDYPNGKEHLMGHFSMRKWYHVVRQLDLRSLKQKWLCYGGRLRYLPFNFHNLLPEPLGYLWHKWYGFWRK